MAMSSVGHPLGKKDYKGAKIAGWTIWALGIITSAMLGLSAVWLIRLPLTWLLCFYRDFGVLGIYLGNTIALAFWTMTGLIRYCSSKWMYKRV